jgi:(p)ppGpp synthase/HD superfamily hydrolase
MVNNVYEDFQHLLDEELNDYCGKAVWAHDTIEDTRVSYNDVKNQLGDEVADIVYAVTNDKGKNRKERAGDKYYEGIRNTPGAVFVKLCDRIANVQYGKMTKSRMFEMYKKENPEFILQLGYGTTYGFGYGEMFVYLNNLFND